MAIQETQMETYICNAEDHQYIQNMASLLSGNIINPLIRHINLRLSFYLNFELNPSLSIDELNLDDELRNDKAWNTFIQRMDLFIACFNAQLPQLRSVKLTLDVDLSSRSSLQEDMFHRCLESLLQACHSNSTTTAAINSPKISLVFGQHSTINDISPILKTVKSIGKSIHKFKIKRHTGLWYPSRITQILEFIGPLRSLELQDGARINSTFLQTLGNFHGATLKSFRIRDPDGIDDEALVRDLLCKTPIISKICLNGAISTWSRISTGSFYLAFQGKAVRDLDVSNCVRIPPQFFQTVATHCHLLSNLKASHSNISDITIAPLILRKDSRLEYLDLGFCEGISVHFLAALASQDHGLKRLREINVVGCRNIFYNNNFPGGLPRPLMADGLQQNGATFTLSEAQPPVTTTGVPTPATPFNPFRSVMIMATQTCPKLESLRVGPIFSNRKDMLEWCLLANAGVAQDEVELKGVGRWSGSLATDRYCSLEMRVLRKFATFMQDMDPSRAALIGLTPLYYNQNKYH